MSTQDDRKQAIILNYNTNNGGVDNLDKVTGIQLQEENCLWPLTIFKIIIAISTSNNLQCLCHMEGAETYLVGKQELEVIFWGAWKGPCIQKQQHLSHTAAPAALVRQVQRPENGPDQELTQEASTRGQERRRCNICPTKKNRNSDNRLQMSETHMRTLRT